MTKNAKTHDTEHQAEPDKALVCREPARGEKDIVGWREWVAFPDFGNIRVKAKVDTGAQTSAIHVWNPEIVVRHGKKMVSFDIHPLQRDDETIASCLAELCDQRSVKNSGGQEEERLFVRTRVQLGDKIHPIEISLTNRDEMNYRMLLGRALLRGRYLVDSEASFLLGE